MADRDAPALFDTTPLHQRPDRTDDVRAELLDDLLAAVWEWMAAGRTARAAATAPPSWRRRGETHRANRTAGQARRELLDTYERVAVEVARLDGHA